jgi:hypothetical protein
VSKPNPFMKQSPHARKRPRQKPAPSLVGNPFAARALAKAQAKNREEKPNPFVRAPKGKGHIPTEPIKRSEEEWENLLERGYRLIDDAGVEVGDDVRITWDYDVAYGPGISMHIGTVVHLSDKIESRPNSDQQGTLRIPLYRIKAIEVVAKGA